jgi:hypothetical protein
VGRNRTAKTDKGDKAMNKKEQQITSEQLPSTIK